MAGQTDTPLYLPASLPYPIQISSTHCSPGSAVTRTQRLLTYSHFVRQSATPAAAAVAGVGSSKDDEGEKRVLSYDSPVEGELLAWKVDKGTVLKDASKPVAVIREPCGHAVQFQGICAICGKDLTRTDYTGHTDTARANLKLAHDVSSITVSLDEAQRLDKDDTNRLKRTGKLSLIVDLDQTIIHATVDPTVGEWRADPRNPNRDALQNVGDFKLSTHGDVPIREGDTTQEASTYYIKQRPGLQSFLREMAKKYEMHVYTMGTRSYAVKVCEIIDPDGRIFGQRILTRDESGSLTQKSLERLFPVDQSMVVIIDDRGDVWDWSKNLLKVIPYDFFVGIGDINSAFLPKNKPSGIPVGPQPTATPTAPPTPAPASTGGDIAVGDSPSKSEALAATANVIHDQVVTRPLLKMQEELTAQVKSEGKKEHVVPAVVNPLDVTLNGNADEPSSDEEDSEHEDAEEEPNVPILRDDDDELKRLQGLLEQVHREFYAKLRASKTAGASQAKLEAEADVRRIIPEIKRKVLGGARPCHLLFSSVIALDVNPRSSEAWRTAEAFGATCHTELTSKVTHVVTNQAGTSKVHAARRMKDVKIVWSRWLVDSVDQWRRAQERDYAVEPHRSGSSRRSTHSPPVYMDDPGLDDDLPDDPDAPKKDKGKGKAEAPAEAEEDLGAPPLSLDDIDWGDAMAEMEDLSDDSDDDETGSESGSVHSAGGGASRKRARTKTDSDDERSDKPLASRPAESEAMKGTGSPLSKRQKLARARTSGLRNPLDLSTDRSSRQPSTSRSRGPTRPGSTNGSRAPSPLREGSHVDSSSSDEESAVGTQDGTEDDDDDFENMAKMLEAELG